jgi:ectoine hydroxylase-related dioxygenase (phytanoyl-CoA dioxygenase family)
VPTVSPAPASLDRAAHLSSDEIADFDERGYLVLRNRIPAALLERLRNAGDAWIEQGHALAESGAPAPDFSWATRPHGRVMYRVDYVHDKRDPASLELLGSPAILGIAESLAGENFVPTYESMVFKDEGDGAAINWHQDAVHPRAYRVFNVDIYLDASRKGEGALRVAPGSQKQVVDVCDLQDEYGWDAPGVIQVEMNPGDVLVHDVMLVHGSEAVTGNRRRRTIYYEFRPAEQILAEGPWDEEFIDQRLRLVPLGLAEYARQNPESAPFTWNVSARFAPETSGDRETELRIAHLVHTSGSFCSASSAALPEPVA